MIRILLVIVPTSVVRVRSPSPPSNTSARFTSIAPSLPSWVCAASASTILTSTFGMMGSMLIFARSSCTTTTENDCTIKPPSASSARTIIVPESPKEAASSSNENSAAIPSRFLSDKTMTLPLSSTALKLRAEPLVKTSPKSTVIDASCAVLP